MKLKISSKDSHVSAVHPPKLTAWLYCLLLFCSAAVVVSQVYGHAAHAADKHRTEVNRSAHMDWPYYLIYTGHMDRIMGQIYPLTNLALWVKSGADIKY